MEDSPASFYIEEDGLKCHRVQVEENSVMEFSTMQQMMHFVGPMHCYFGISWNCSGTIWMHTLNNRIRNTL